MYTAFMCFLSITVERLTNYGLFLLIFSPIEALPERLRTRTFPDLEELYRDCMDIITLRVNILNLTQVEKSTGFMKINGTY